MEEHTKEELLDYVADMAEQLATLCRPHDPNIATVLHVAAELAREKLQQG